MSSVLDPAELAASPLADLHLLANELGVDGFRRLRKAQLVDAILVAQGGEPAPPAPEIDATDVPSAPETDDSAAAPEADDAERPARRRSRGGRSRSQRATEETEEATAAGDEAEAVEEQDRPRRRSRGTRAPRAARLEATQEGGDGGDESPARGEAAESSTDDKVVEGVIELVGNGSAFIRLPADSGGDDVYVSAAQVKRTELVAGDRVAGPVRPPRRSERHPSLIRVDSINGRPADEVSEGTRFEDLPAAYPTERFELNSEDPTVKAVEWLTPFGKGSRVTVVGPPLSGKTEALVRLADALRAIEGLELSLVLAGTRPEEVAVWAEHGLTPIGAAGLGASPEAQSQVIEQAVEQAKRQAARGAHAVLIVDSVEQLPLPASRRALGAARALVDGGSLTIVASAPVPVGGETTIIALDQTLTALRRFPAVDLAASATLRADLLVGEAGAEAIAKARAEVML